MSRTTTKVRPPVPMKLPAARKRDRRKPLTRSQRAIYTVLLRFGPLTDGELVTQYDVLRHHIGLPSRPLSPSGIRTRRVEAQTKGWVTTGPTRRTPLGRKSRAHRAVV